ncbi:MAG: peptidoglycan bridge formation glycyltransferase FemA/FemB family protein [bacterium]
MASGAFLQSNGWAKFQESLGRKTWRVDGALVIKMPLKFGFSYFYSPKGPAGKLQITNYELRIKETAKKKRAIFWRVEPTEMPPKNFIKIKDIQPSRTLITDISKSEDELLAEMHPKTRYNIHLAEKKGIKISTPPFLPLDKGRSKEGFEQFYNLLQKTSARQKIKLHSKNYYQKLLTSSDHNYHDRDSYGNEIFIAYFNNQPVATAMVNFYGDTATYLHGGSDEKYKALMAPHLLHWEIIKTAKSRGTRFYDWWGVDEKKWPGITRFKRGFGGAEICAPGTFDLPIDKFWYWVYKLIRK